MALYEKGQVRIHYEEAGSGFPLFVIPGGGQNSTIDFMSDPTQCAERPVLRPARDRSALGRMYVTNADFVFSVPPAIESARLAPKSELTFFPWKDTKEKIPLAVRHVRTFLRANRPA